MPGSMQPFTTDRAHAPFDCRLQQARCTCKLRRAIRDVGGVPCNQRWRGARGRQCPSDTVEPARFHLRNQHELMTKFSSCANCPLHWMRHATKLLPAKLAT